MENLFVSGELELLQMVSESNIERCANEDVGSQREVDSKISHWSERGMNHSLQERKTSPCFKTLRKPKMKNLERTISALKH